MKIDEQNLLSIWIQVNQNYLATRFSTNQNNDVIKSIIII